ncbi:MAG TPA: nucleotidyltransferase domain-containing protein [Candidatus Babeliales bacterium]|nr:nucleotidyltransferase domain-containing protein [Candidatus Babeliales bacterium]
MENSVPKNKIIKIIEIFFPDAKIYLFGSRARADHHERSDIDLAIDAGKPISLTEKGQIISMIDALNIPQKTDLVDFHRAPQALKDNILKEGVLWKSLGTYY